MLRNLSHDITHPDQRSFPTPPTPPPPPPIKEWQPNPLSANPVHSSIMVDLDKLSGISDYDDMFSRLSVESGVEGWYCSICYCMASRNKESSVYCDSCSGLFCLDCMHIHLRTRITGGFIILKCPGDSCTRTITDEEIDLHCSEWMHIFVKNRVDADNNPRVKTCPGCNIVQHFEEPDEVPIHHKCGSCGLRWCIPCHAPWHNALTCKEFQKDVIGKGHKALKIAAYAKRLLRMQKVAAYAKRLLRMQKVAAYAKGCCVCKRLLRMRKVAAYAKGCCVCKRLLRMQKVAAYEKGCCVCKKLLRMQKDCCVCKKIAAYEKGLLRAWVVASIDVSIRIDYYACNRREVEDGENMDDIM
eukprot:gene15215-6418_t